jgi:hypothetical protein
MRRVVIIAVSAAIGGVVGWKARVPAVETPPSSPAITVAGETPRPKWTKDDFLTALREKASDGLANPLAEELADWSTAEIRAALEESLESPACRMPGDPASRLPHFLMGVWMQRDFDAARAWFESLDPGKAKEQMASAVAIHWPRERGGEAFDYLLANRELMKRAGFSLVLSGIQFSVNQGPAALVAFMARLRENGFEYPNAIGGGFPMGVQYPAGFDFATLVASDEFARLPVVDEHGAQTTADMLLSKWHARDRDAAYDWILQHRGVEGLNLMAGNFEVKSADNLRWLAGKADALSPADKETFRGSVMPKWVFSPDTLRQFAEASGDPDLVAAARGYGVQALFFGGTRGALAVIEGLDPEARLEMLEAAEPEAGLMKKHRHYRKFDDVDESLLRKKLAEWNAGEERTEAILSRFKP